MKNEDINLRSQQIAELIMLPHHMLSNTAKPRPNSGHFTDDIFKYFDWNFTEIIPNKQ